MNKQYLSKRDIIELISEADEQWKIAIPRVRKMLAIKLDKGLLLISDEAKMIRVRFEDKHILLPFLADKELLAKFPSVEIDMGAIKAICNGASVMRPGIVRMDEFKKFDIVTIRDTNHKQYIAVGIALIGSDEAIGMEHGQIIKNLHYIGDTFWEAYKEI